MSHDVLSSPHNHPEERSDHAVDSPLDLGATSDLCPQQCALYGTQRIYDLTLVFIGENGIGDHLIDERPRLFNKRSPVLSAHSRLAITKESVQHAQPVPARFFHTLKELRHVYVGETGK